MDQNGYKSRWYNNCIALKRRRIVTNKTFYSLKKLFDIANVQDYVKRNNCGVKLSFFQRKYECGTEY